MGEETETPKKGKKNPFAALKPIAPSAAPSQPAEALGPPLSEEEAKQLAAEVFGVPQPSSAVRKAVSADIAAEEAGVGADAEEEAAGEEDEGPDEVVLAAEELGPLAKAIQRGEVTVPRGVVKGFTLIAKAFAQLAEEDLGDESEEAVLTSEEVTPFIQTATVLQLLQELMLGTPERKAAFRAFVEQLPSADQAILAETLRQIPRLLEETPEAIAGVTEADSQELTMLGVSFVQELQKKAQASLDAAAKKG